jgi:hypothetical protein
LAAGVVYIGDFEYQYQYQGIFNMTAFDGGALAVIFFWWTLFSRARRPLPQKERHIEKSTCFYDSKKGHFGLDTKRECQNDIEGPPSKTVLLKMMT